MTLEKQNFKYNKLETALMDADNVDFLSKRVRHGMPLIGVAGVMISTRTTPKLALACKRSSTKPIGLSTLKAFTCTQTSEFSLPSLAGDQIRLQELAKDRPISQLLALPIIME